MGSLLGSGVLSADQKRTPPSHPTVGQRFVPADVDWVHPLYSTSFDDAADSDWKLEGGKRMFVEGGRHVLENTPGGPVRSPNDNHLVCWLVKEIPVNFLLEFQVMPKDRRSGLNIIFFNARDTSGESIFDPALKPRTGIFGQYTNSDLSNYHVSYWAGDRGTANIRKNPGFHLVATGTDRVLPGTAGSFQTIRLYKRDGTIRLMVDDVISVAFDDDGSAYGPVLGHTGWVGLRQMAHTGRCEYDNLKIFPCKP